MDNDGIINIQRAAVAGKLVTEADKPAVILPAGYEIQSLESHNAYRDNFRAVFGTHRIEDFLAYVNKTDSSAPCFIDQKAMSAKTIFDVGTPSQPEHCNHRAFVALEKTPEYVAALRAMFDNPTYPAKHSQQSLAEYFEDYNGIISCVGPADENIPVVKAIAAVRRVTIESRAQSDSEVKQFGSKQSSMEAIEARSGDDQLPSIITLNLTPYLGLGQHVLRCRVSLRINDDKISFVLRPINLEMMEQMCAEEFAGIIKSGIQGDEVYIGSFQV